LPPDIDRSCKIEKVKKPTPVIVPEPVTPSTPGKKKGLSLLKGMTRGISLALKM